MTPSRLPLRRLSGAIGRIWKRTIGKGWRRLLGLEARIGRRLFHRSDRPGWHSWSATAARRGFDRIWECRCGAVRLTEFPTGRPALGDGESSGWPMDVYATVWTLLEDEDVCA